MPTKALPHALALLTGLTLAACDSAGDTAAPQAGSAAVEQTQSSPDSLPAPDDGWQRARQEAEARLARPARIGRARNVILFVADGMSVPTVTAARIYEGQEQGLLGSEHRLTIDSFPDMALVRTYNTDAQVADSASTATALLTGYKTRTGAVSVRADQYLDACAAGADVPATLLELAEGHGLATGFVTTARITHATPATAYAHSISRGWESDDELPAEAVDAGCMDIAAQLIGFERGDGIEVALGGGRGAFLPDGEGGMRLDGRDLTAEWTGDYVASAGELRELDSRGGAPVLGLFTPSHMAFEADRDDAAEPSLAEMTRFAIDRLSQDTDGYFLLVEAGRVDHAHHGTNAYRALTDMQAFDAAIAAALDRVDLDDTLVVVTADHGHVFSLAGYPARGNPILGLVRRADPMHPGSEPGLSFAADGKPYTTLGYQNGPNPRTPDSEALTQAQVLDPDFRQQSAVPFPNESHSGADVALYANGARSHYFGGSLEQNTVFHLILAAYGWPPEDETDGTAN